MAYGHRDPDDALVIGVTNGVARPDRDEATARRDEAPPDATRPVGGTVPQAAPPRPAEPPAVAAPSGRRPRTATFPGSYSFDPVPPVTWGRRLRSALGVVLVITVVGLALAASFGVLAVFVSRALEGAVN